MSNSKDKIKTESDIKIFLAKNQAKILNLLFKNIKNDKFDLNVDLSSIPAESIRDFWVYTAGFLGVQNFDQIISSLPENEIDSMINGQFLLKELTDAEADKLAASAGTKINRRGFGSKTPLYTIQDGNYYILKNLPIDRAGKRYITCISLETDGVKLFTDRDDIEMTNEQAMHIIRNLMVHTTPYINGTRVNLFAENDDYFQISKMWLRGYSELFSQAGSVASQENIKQILEDKLPVQANYLDNIQDVHNALTLVKDCFGKENSDSNFRVHNFIDYRLLYIKDFYKKSLDEKIDILSTILANNPNYTTSSSGTINPAIIYNLQQLVSKELVKRNLEANLSEEDIEVEKLVALNNKAKELIKKYDDLEAKYTKNLSPFLSRQSKQISREIDSILRQFEFQQKKLENRRKLESSHMEMYNLNGLEHLPIEIAVNIVCLMGYNNLVTSGFYEDLLANTDYNNLSKEQSAFFSKFNFDGISYTFNNGEPETKFSPSQKAYLLASLRNAICHGQFSFKLPFQTKNPTCDFQNIQLKFVASWDNLEIKGKLIDFYNLFNLSPFTLARNKSIVTGTIREIDSDDFENEDVPENNDFQNQKQ